MVVYLHERVMHSVVGMKRVPPSVKAASSVLPGSAGAARMKKAKE